MNKTELSKLYPGLDYMANFINSLDTEGMSVKDVRTVIYTECLSPGSYYRGK